MKSYNFVERELYYIHFSNVFGAAISKHPYKSSCDGD